MSPSSHPISSSHQNVRSKGAGSGIEASFDSQRARQSAKSSSLEGRVSCSRHPQEPSETPLISPKGSFLGMCYLLERCPERDAGGRRRLASGNAADGHTLRERILSHRRNRIPRQAVADATDRSLQKPTSENSSKDIIASKTAHPHRFTYGKKLCISSIDISMRQEAENMNVPFPKAPEISKSVNEFYLYGCSTSATWSCVSSAKQTQTVNAKK
ncbi:hypothetical protein HDV57DRAFT_108256 [Trichoderma longibrachiatum]